VKYVSAGLFLLSYLLAVVDGTRQDTAIYPSGAGRVGWRRYCSAHPFIVAGGVCGVAGTVVGLL